MRMFCKCGRDVGKFTLHESQTFLCRCGKGYVVDVELQAEVELARRVRTAVENSTEALVKDILERL